MNQVGYFTKKTIMFCLFVVVRVCVPVFNVGRVCVLNCLLLGPFGKYLATLEQSKQMSGGGGGHNMDPDVA